MPGHRKGPPDFDSLADGARHVRESPYIVGRD
jgi:hypothetical protein